MLKTDNILNKGNRLSHLMRLNVFNGISEQDAIEMELLKKDFEVKEGINNGITELRGMLITPYQSKKRKSISIANYLIGNLPNFLGSHNLATADFVKIASKYLRFLNSPDEHDLPEDAGIVLDSDIDSAVIHLLNCSKDVRLIPLFSGITADFMAYPKSNGHKDPKQLEAWVDKFTKDPTVTSMRQLLAKIEKENGSVETPTPFFEGNSSEIFNDVLKLFWAINSYTNHIYILEAMVTEGFVKAIHKAIANEETVTSTKKYYRELYNELNNIMEEDTNQYYVNSRPLLLLTLLNEMMEVKS